MLFNVFMDWMKYRAKYKAQSLKTTMGVRAGSAMRAGINRGVEGAVGGGKKGVAGAKGAAAKAGEQVDKAKDGGKKAAKKAGGKKAKEQSQEKKVGLFNKKKGGGGDDEDGDGRPSGGFKAERTVAVRIAMDEPLEVCGWIVALNGNHRGQDFRLVTGKNVIGTAADCDIVITDPYLSSKHATIRHDAVDGSFTVIDLDSTNGTFVNDKRASKEELIDNDTIRLGRTEMKFKALF